MGLLDSFLDAVGGIFSNSSPTALLPSGGGALNTAANILTNTQKQGGSDFWGPLFAAGITGGLGAYSGISQANIQSQDKATENQQALAEAEKQREFDKWKLLTTLAAKGGGGGGGGGGSGAALLNVRRQALADMLNAALTQRQQGNDSLALFLKGTQEPYARLLGR